LQLSSIHLKLVRRVDLEFVAGNDVDLLRMSLRALATGDTLAMVIFVKDGQLHAEIGGASSASVSMMEVADKWVHVRVEFDQVNGDRLSVWTVVDGGVMVDGALLDVDPSSGGYLPVANGDDGSAMVVGGGCAGSRTFGVRRF